MHATNTGLSSGLGIPGHRSIRIQQSGRLACRPRRPLPRLAGYCWPEVLFRRRPALGDLQIRSREFGGPDMRYQHESTSAVPAPPVRCRGRDASYRSPATPRSKTPEGSPSRGPQAMHGPLPPGTHQDGEQPAVAGCARGSLINRRRAINMAPTEPGMPLAPSRRSRALAVRPNPRGSHRHVTISHSLSDKGQNDVTVR